MEWHVNDLSIDGQFPTSDELRKALEPILAARARYRSLRGRLYCSRMLHDRQAGAGLSLQAMVRGCLHKMFKVQVLVWLANSGPFWDDGREPNKDDYFEHDDIDVTDQGLGEAARRRLVGRDARSFSFVGCPKDFSRSPLIVEQGIPEDRLSTTDIPNNWTIASIAAAIEAGEPAPENWEGVLEKLKEKFPELIYSEGILEQLKGNPFSKGIADRAEELLRVLHELVLQSGEDGKLTETGLALLNNHFVGEKAWFSDESAAHKAKFKKELTFKDPLNGSKSIFCPWHGKIKISQYRIHFEWLRPKGQRRIKVVYFGPKITKA